MKFRKDAIEGRAELPDMLLKALASLEAESLVVLPGEVIEYQTPGLENYGITNEGRIINEDLIALIRVVRRTNETHRGSLELARGPIGEGKRDLTVSVTPLNEDGVVLALICSHAGAQIRPRRSDRSSVRRQAPSRSIARHASALGRGRSLLQA